MGFKVRRKYYNYDTGPMKIGKAICSICDYHYMGSPAYVILFSLIGILITAFDILRVLDCKMALKSTPSNQSTKKVPVNVEKDLKLVTSILGIEHYTLIILGAVTNYPMLFVPWLMMQSCILIIEIFIFCGRIFMDGLHIKRDEVFLFFWSTHNWIQVFCFFLRHSWYT